MILQEKTRVAVYLFDEMEQLLSVLAQEGWKGDFECPLSNFEKGWRKSLEDGKPFRVYLQPGKKIGWDVFPMLWGQATDWPEFTLVALRAPMKETVGLSHWNCKCTRCGCEAYMGLNLVECSNSDCKNYK